MVKNRRGKDLVGKILAGGRLSRKKSLGIIPAGKAPVTYNSLGMFPNVDFFLRNNGKWKAIRNCGNYSHWLATTYLSYKKICFLFC